MYVYTYTYVCIEFKYVCIEIFTYRRKCNIYTYIYRRKCIFGLQYVAHMRVHHLLCVSLNRNTHIDIVYSYVNVVECFAAATWPIAAANGGHVCHHHAHTCVVTCGHKTKHILQHVK